MPTRSFLSLASSFQLRRRSWITATIALFAGPALLDLFADPRRAPIHWIAVDTFYYLVVGRHAALTGRFSFDGTHWSNGYHPLWQLVVTGLEVARIGLHIDRQWAPFVVVCVGLALIAAAIRVLGVTMLRTRRLGPGFLLLPVGLYALMVLPIWSLGLAAIAAHGYTDWTLPVFGTLWSEANGMESALTIFFFAIALSLATRARSQNPNRAAVHTGLALAGLTLARLDHGLVAAGLLGAYLVVLHRERGGRRAMGLAIASFALALLPYLLLNRVVFGGFVPVSGAAKSTFPHFGDENLTQLRGLFAGNPSAHVDGQNSIWFLPTFARIGQMLIPPVLCAALIGARCRRTWDRLDVMLAGAGLGVLFLAIYDFAFTRYGGQGYWYYPVSTLVPTLLVLTTRRRGARPRKWVFQGAFGTGVATLVIWVFARWHRHPAYDHNYVRFLTETAPAAVAHYGGKVPKFLEIDDGVVGYALAAEAHPCDLALDPDGARALRENRLLDLVVDRGFLRVASFAYQAGTTDDQLSHWLAETLHQDLARFIVHAEYVAPDGLLTIATITRRSR